MKPLNQYHYTQKSILAKKRKKLELEQAQETQQELSNKAYQPPKRTPEELDRLLEQAKRDNIALMTSNNKFGKKG